MAISSMDHDFVVKDKKNVQNLIEALSTPPADTAKPVKFISGKEVVTAVMRKWQKNK